MTEIQKPVISVEHIYKGYKIYPDDRSRLLEWIIPGGRERHEKKWVLRDVDFKVYPGEAVALVGMNGAGKSTLLKIITGTTVPTSGRIGLSGRVSALLELGMGFHPDFTGRQNAYMSGQLLGYSTEEITEHMQGIEDFAEIGAAIDEPVRTYSSGMQVRLAFSVATMIRPDVLIVDEALSVGDSYFQHKSFDRIKKYKEQGTTLLLVSHDPGAVQAICDRAYLLHQGSVLTHGDPEYVMNYYNAMLAKIHSETDEIKTQEGEGGVKQLISGGGQASAEKIYILNEHGEEVKIVGVGEPVTLVVEALIHEPVVTLVVGIQIKNVRGECMYGTNTFIQHKVLTNLKPGQQVKASYKFNMNLSPANYSISTCLSLGDIHSDGNYEWKDLAFIFDVIPGNKDKFAGCAWLDAKSDVELMEQK